MKSDPDAILMTAFRNGDGNAFRILFDRYKTKIINFCFRFCGHREIAEDLAQEVFLRVYKAAPNYTSDAKFSTWIFRIATNVCLNELRRPGYRYKTESVDAQPTHSREGYRKFDIADPNSAPQDNEIENREQENIIMESIQNLPEKQRAALLLLIHQGFSYQEIGRQINRSESGVKSLIHRARETLKKTLKTYLRGDTYDNAM